MYLVYIFAFIVAISLKVEKPLSLASICIQFVRILNLAVLGRSLKSTITRVKAYSLAAAG